MPVFHFEAVDAAGTRSHGTQEAVDPTALALLLERRGLFVLDASEAAPARRDGFTFSRRRDVLEFTRAMSALLLAGLPLARALASAADSTTGSVRVEVDEVRARVVRGESLASALAAANGFPPLYVGLVRAGETRGDLATAFSRLAAQLEREEQLRGRVLSALLYPLLLTVAGGAAIVVLLTVVLPQFSAILTDTGAPLPRSTRLLLWLSATTGRAWPLLLALPIVVITLLAWARRDTTGRAVLARWLLAAPFVGTLRRQVLGARFARLLGTLLAGGAPLFAALGDVIASTDDPVARDEIEAVRTRVREGAALREALALSTLFPPLLVQLVGIGEESARVREFLFKAADILDERAERTAQRLATLAEPTMIVLFGAIVSLIAFSLLQAINSVNAGAFVR